MSDVSALSAPMYLLLSRAAIGPGGGWRSGRKGEKGSGKFTEKKRKQEKNEGRNEEKGEEKREMRKKEEQECCWME